MHTATEGSFIASLLLLPATACRLLPLPVVALPTAAAASPAAVAHCRYGTGVITSLEPDVTQVGVFQLCRAQEVLQQGLWS
jgi:hypothetical protein